MMSQEKRAPRSKVFVATAPVEALTADELRRLTAFQRSCDYQPQCVEWELDPRRLEFVRWLIEHGRLSDDLGQG
jgi:hypothetical protein